MMKNKSRFWPQFWVLGSYIKVEGAAAHSKIEGENSHYSIVLL